MMKQWIARYDRMNKKWLAAVQKETVYACSVRHPTILLQVLSKVTELHMTGIQW